MTQEDNRPFAHVVAGVLVDSADRVLIAQRPAGKHMAGGWEFPGGKLEPGEERLAGLARELREELGIVIIGSPRPLIRVRHAYPSREVLLDIWVVKHFRGEPRGLDGQALRWCTQDELATAELLPADKPIVRALRLPERLTQASTEHYTAHEWQPSPSGDLSEIEVKADTKLRGTICTTAKQAISATRAGAEFLVMRDALPVGRLSALCRTVPVPVFARGFSTAEIWALGASGINDINP